MAGKQQLWVGEKLLMTSQVKLMATKELDWAWCIEWDSCEDSNSSSKVGTRSAQGTQVSTAMHVNRHFSKEPSQHSRVCSAQNHKYFKVMKL